MNLNRALTRKELALVLALTLAFLGLFYYRFVYLNVQDQLAEYDTSALESEIAVEQAKAARMKNMQAEIEINRGNETGQVATYDNIKNEIDLLNDILMASSEYQLGWEQPEATGDTVRRNVSITYTAPDYEKALDIIRQIYQSKCRTLIRTAALTPNGSQDSQTLDNGPVSVSMDVTFYETLNGAASTDGLIITDSDSDTAAAEAAGSSEDTGFTGE